MNPHAAGSGRLRSQPRLTETSCSGNPERAPLLCDDKARRRGLLHVNPKSHQLPSSHDTPRPPPRLRATANDFQQFGELPALACYCPRSVNSSGLYEVIFTIYAQRGKQGRASRFSLQRPPSLAGLAASQEPEPCLWTRTAVAVAAAFCEETRPSRGKVHTVRSGNDCRFNGHLFSLNGPATKTLMTAELPLAVSVYELARRKVLNS